MGAPGIQPMEISSRLRMQQLSIPSSAIEGEGVILSNSKNVKSISINSVREEQASPIIPEYSSPSVSIIYNSASRHRNSVEGWKDVHNRERNDGLESFENSKLQKIESSVRDIRE